MRYASQARLLGPGLLLFALIGCDNTDKSGTGVSDTAGDTASGEPSTEITYDDADGDGIIDSHEGEGDLDEDGIPNYLDEDSDGDGIPDRVEAGDDDALTLPVDSDGDGTPDYLDLDSDNNCISDEEESGGSTPDDTDGDGVGDYADDDNDGDGITDIYEIGESCEEPDTDGDGTSDYMDKDSDGDGIGDKYEAGTTDWEKEPQDTDGDGIYDYLDDDSDGDGIPDSIEGGSGSADLEPRDTDGDGAYDFEDTDADGDGLADSDEADLYDTDPYDPDTDGDGFSDGGEVAADTDPLDPASVIDGLYVEVPERTTSEELFEFELRIQMGDVAFALDTTCSMSSTASAMASEFSAIVSQVESTLPDAEFGHATFDDYAYGSYGSAGTDKPFELRQQITNDTAAVQSVLSATRIHSGADGPESTIEALYQGATGAGYDQGCNGTYDTNYDVMPFLATGSDPFGGTGGQFYDAASTGGGTLGGYGFRDYSLPIIVYATDNYLRDPDAGYGTPGGCPLDAGSSDVAAAVTALGAYLIGVSTYSTYGVPAMQSLAAATESYADTDGDGMADDVLVFSWYGSSTTFRETVVEAIEDLVSSIQFHTLKLEVEGDEWGFVTGIDPEYYDIEGSVSGEIIDFTLEFRGVVAATTEDQLFKLTLNVIGDDTILLDTMDIIIVVPGTAY